jgi:NAD(P)H-dependent FMN reductase
LSNALISKAFSGLDNRTDKIRRNIVEKLFLPVLLGTNRKNRNSVHAAKWLIGEMQKRPEIETRLFDATDFALPRDDYGQGLKDLFPEWRDAFIRADVLVIV